MESRFVASVFATTLMTGAALNGCHGTDCLVDPGPLNCNSFEPGTDMSGADFGADLSLEGQLQLRWEMRRHVRREIRTRRWPAIRWDVQGHVQRHVHAREDDGFV